VATSKYRPESEHRATVTLCGGSLEQL